MKRLWLFVLMLCFLTQVDANTFVEQLDSAFQFLKAHPKNVDKHDEFCRALNRTYNSLPDTTYYYASEEAKMAKHHKFYEAQANALNISGICLEITGHLDSAILQYKKAETIAREHNLINQLADAYNNLGICYSYKSLYEFSLEYTLKALNVAVEQGDTMRISSIYNNLGLRYSELSNQEKAIYYYKLAIQINEASNKNNAQRKLVTNLNNLGRSYFILHKNDSASYYYKNALKLGRDIESYLNHIELVYNGLSYVSLRESLFEKAKQYADTALQIAIDIGDIYGEKNFLRFQGDYHLSKKEYQKAIPFLEEVKSWSLENGYKTDLPELYKSLSLSYEGIGNFKEALKYHQKYANQRDSSFSKDKDRAMEQMVLYKEAKQQKERELLNVEINQRQEKLETQKLKTNIFILIGFLLLAMFAVIANRYLFEKKTKRALAEKNQIISKEKERSEELLLNILPEEVANELKLTGESKAQSFDEVTVLFTDFIAFTKTSESLGAEELVRELNICFKAFDNIITSHKLEKIKTIGDAYMAAGGLSGNKKTTPKRVALAALEMQQFMKNRFAELNQKEHFRMRCGLHTGHVVAGIVGLKKFQYDIWGDTVNTAARMENTCDAGKVNISESTYNKLKDEPGFNFIYRGKVEAKGKGKLDMWYVEKSSQNA